jgi:hypothetical protein
MYNSMNQDWFHYDDGTSDAGAIVAGQKSGGCDSVDSCAFHTSGSNYTNYGAGAGITLASNNIFDASQYTGLDVWFRGTTQGTRGPNYSVSNNTVHVKFVTGFSDDAGADPRNGDDFGAYCPTTADDGGSDCYVECKIPFVALQRDGFRGVDSGAPDPSTDMFDPQNLVKIQFEFSLYNGPDGGVPVPVSFDLWIDDVSWYK